MNASGKRYNEEATSYRNFFFFFPEPTNILAVLVDRGDTLIFSACLLELVRELATLPPLH